MNLVVFCYLQHLAGNGDFAQSESWSGPDPDPDPDSNKQRHAYSDAVQKKNLRETLFSGKGEKTKGALTCTFFLLIKRKEKKRKKSQCSLTLHCTIHFTVQKEVSDVDIEDGNQHLDFDSARNSFSLALKGSFKFIYN